MTVTNNASDHSMMQIRDEGGDLVPPSNVDGETSSLNRNSQEKAISSIQEKLHQKQKLPYSKSNSIFRIPNVLSKHNEKAFVPHLVSIGPIHHGEKKLRDMEEIKLWYLHCLLDRKPTPETKLDYFVEVITGIEEDCRACYGEKIDMSSEKFVEMMVVDGCFIIEYFRKEAYMVRYHPDDPLNNTAWMRSVVANDLFLLENQLPWKVVDCLFRHTKAKGMGDYSLLKLALKFFQIDAFDHMVQRNKELETRHLLDGIRNSLIASYKPKLDDDTYWTTIPSVTELLQAGVKFKCKTEAWDNVLNITFKDGVMEIPPLDIRESGESLFRNLIAYEQCDPSILIYNITSYAVVMDNLINTSEDAEYLVQKRVINSRLSKDDLACFFNGLYKNVIAGHFCYTELSTNVNTYYTNRWHRWQTILRRDYFNNPWSIFSFGAALLVLAFTFMQTLYSMKSYYQASDI